MAEDHKVAYIHPVLDENEDLPLESSYEQFTVGSRIKMGEMNHDPLPIPAGTYGTITDVHYYDPPVAASYSIWEDGRPVKTGIPAENIRAQISVDWDNGRSLMLLVPADDFEVVGGPDDGD